MIINYMRIRVRFAMVEFGTTRANKTKDDTINNLTK